MTRITNVTTKLEDCKIEITPEMIEAGENAILGEVGGADLGGYFSASDLATTVYRAMAALDLSRRHPGLARNRKA